MYLFLLLINCQTYTVPAEVEGRRWNYFSHREEYMEVTRSDWENEIPVARRAVYPVNGFGESPGYSIVSCTSRKHHEDCDWVYRYDFFRDEFKWVKDCDDVYMDYCEYLTNTWVTVKTFKETGFDLNPHYPEMDMTNPYQRVTHSQEFDVVIGYTFDEKELDYIFHPENFKEYDKWTPKQQVMLELSYFGDVKQIMTLEEIK